MYQIIIILTPKNSIKQIELNKRCSLKYTMNIDWHLFQKNETKQNKIKHLMMSFFLYFSVYCILFSCILFTRNF